jgi:hypothetical protein
MKTSKLIFFFLLSFLLNTAHAAATPSFKAIASSSNINIGKIKPGVIEKLTGKRMTLLQKIQLKLLQKRIRRIDGDGEMTEKQKDWATTSLVLGLSSFGLVLIPIIGILAIPAAILAIVFGVKSLKGNSNTKGIIGIVAGGLFLLLFVAAIVIILSNGFWI